MLVHVSEFNLLAVDFLDEFCRSGTFRNALKLDLNFEQLPGPVILP